MRSLSFRITNKIVVQNKMSNMIMDSKETSFIYTITLAELIITLNQLIRSFMENKRKCIALLANSVKFGTARKHPSNATYHPKKKNVSVCHEKMRRTRGMKLNRKFAAEILLARNSH